MRIENVIGVTFRTFLIVYSSKTVRCKLVRRTFFRFQSVEKKKIPNSHAYDMVTAYYARIVLGSRGRGHGERAEIVDGPLQRPCPINGPCTGVIKRK